MKLTVFPGPACGPGSWATDRSRGAAGDRPGRDPGGAHSDKQGAAPTYKQGFSSTRLLAFLDRGRRWRGYCCPAAPDPTSPPTPGGAGHGGGRAATSRMRAADPGLRPARMRSWTISCAAGMRSRSGSTATSGSAPRGWACPSRPGSPPWTPMATSARAHGCASMPQWTWPVQAGLRGPRAIWRQERPTLAPVTRWASPRAGAPLPGLHHHPDRPRHHPSGGPPPGACADEGQLPLRQGHRPAQPPLTGLDANDAWLALVGVAATLVCWAQALLLDGDLERAEPKTLRCRLWHTAGCLVPTPAASSSAWTAPGPGRPRRSKHSPCCTPALALLTDAHAGSRSARLPVGCGPLPTLGRALPRPCCRVRFGSPGPTRPGYVPTA